MSANKEEVKPVYDEAALKDFVLASTGPDKEKAARLVDSIIKDAANDSVVYKKTDAFLGKAFGHPNSIYRNQALYSKLLKAKINKKWLGSNDKEKAKERLQLLQQNNIGNPANEFTYITPTGYEKRMYDIKANFLLIYFNNPECNACKEMKQALSSSIIINQKLKIGALKILSIYTDKDEKLWWDYLSKYPESWIQGRDEDEHLYKNKVYDLIAIPTVYLLDKNKKVLLKDGVDVGEIERELSKYN
jgi:hypothetical protein